MGIKGVLRLLLCMSLLTATSGWAAEIHGRSSTQYLWFNDYWTGNKQAEFGEYLNLSITKIDPAGKFSIQGYGRMTQDILNGQGFNGRLYYLYGDYRDLFDKVDIRVGRQFINYAAGTALVDGGKIDLKNIGPIAFSAMGGRNVIFDLDSGEYSNGNAFVWGLAANLAGFKNTDAELSYFVKLDDAGTAREQIGGTFKQYLFNFLKLYGNARFDMTSASFSEVLLGMKYYPVSNLVLTGEWYQSYPIFDNSSIYSVFAVDRYQEAVFRGDYTFNEKFSVNAGYTRQIYGEGPDVNAYEIGTRIRPFEPLVISLNYDFQSGDGNILNGGGGEITYTPIKPLDLSGGIEYDVYQRDSETGRETARKYWLGAKYRINKSMSASIRAEDNVNHQFTNDWSGRAVFNYDF